MSSKSQNPMNDFFQIFNDAAVKTLHQNLDNDTYKKIEIITDTSSTVHEVEDLKQSNVLYKIDFARGGAPSTLVVLLPENLLASIADVIMGGSGEDETKEQLSELDVNAAQELLNKIFKEVESTFKQIYAQDLAFSAEPMFVLKEMPEYTLKSPDVHLDLLINNNLIINEEKEYKIGFLLNNDYIQSTLADLGLLKSNAAARSLNMSGMDIEKLADVQIEITAELGRAKVPIKYALELVKDSIVELDTLNNSDIKVFANGVEVALAQVVAVDEDFGLKITKIISPEERLGSI